MKDSSGQDQRLPPSVLRERYWIMATAFVCVLFGAFIAWGIREAWELDDKAVMSTFKGQMMHRKTRTMEHILDGLVRGDLRRVEKSAEHMKSIGVHLNWYSSEDLYGNHDVIFRDSTAKLIETAQQGDLDAAKEAALRLERSCIECHALINRDSIGPSNK